jgi:hypothetical protein
VSDIQLSVQGFVWVPKLLSTYACRLYMANTANLGCVCDYVSDITDQTSTLFLTSADRGGQNQRLVLIIMKSVRWDWEACAARKMAFCMVPMLYAVLLETHSTARLCVSI